MQRTEKRGEKNEKKKNAVPLDGNPDRPLTVMTISAAEYFRSIIRETVNVIDL